jgi:hypothetical protein
MLVFVVKQFIYNKIKNIKKTNILSPAREKKIPRKFGD